MAANLFKRMTYVALDQYGVDPMADKAFKIIDQVEGYTEYTVGLHEAENLPLISYNFYDKNKHLWWIIQAYNGVLDITEVTAGTVLRMPSITELTALFAAELRAETISRSGSTEF